MITSEQLEEFLFLPEPRRRLNEIVNDLCDGKSVIHTLPASINPAIIYSIIADECRESGLEFNVFKYDDDDFELLPENFIAQCCGMSFSPGEQVSVERIFEEGKIGDVTSITLPKLPPEMVKHWARLLRQWSEYARTYQARTKQCPVSLLLVTHQVELSRGIKEDVYLKAYYFWGWISTVELLLVARSVASEQGLTLDESLWVESVFVELAGTDPELFFWLLDRCPFSDTANMWKAIIQQLIGFCEGKGWTQKRIVSCLDLGEHNNCREFAQSCPLIPPSDLDPLWSAGVASWNDGDGIFIHSATLAVQGDTATLKHRIWRGQARVLLPVLDRIRHEICDYLNRKFKREWSSFCETNRNPYLPGASSYQNGVAEYGVINEFFRLNESKGTMLRQLRRPVEHLRLTRNNLAHYVPLNWVQFSQIIGEVKKVERCLVG